MTNAAIVPSPLSKLCGPVLQHKTSFNQPPSCVLIFFNFNLKKRTYHIYVHHRIENKDFEASMYSVLSTLISKMHGMNNLNKIMKPVGLCTIMFLTSMKMTTLQHFIQ